MKSRVVKINDNINYHDGRYQVVKSFNYMGYEIPKWFAWNGVTWFITDKKLILPSMIHDFLLSIGVEREICDKVFLKAMKKEGVWAIRRYTYYSFVRANSLIGGN